MRLGAYPVVLSNKRASAAEKELGIFNFLCVHKTPPFGANGGVKTS